MILTDVLTACDMNPLYYKFIPIFIKTWKKLFPEVNIHIILIGEKIIEELELYKEYIKLFSPIEGIKTSFIAQNIRLFYPGLIDADGGVLITDMDIIPMNRSYYIDNIKNISQEKFVTYRPLSCVGKKEIAICYNIAHTNIWKDIFQILSVNDIIIRLKNIYEQPKYIGENANKYYEPFWITDQLYLYEKIQEWIKQTNSHIIFDDKVTKFNRLDRNYFYNINKSNISNYIYTDFHMFRPYNEYQDINNKVVNLL